MSSMRSTSARNPTCRRGRLVFRDIVAEAVRPRSQTRCTGSRAVRVKTRRFIGRGAASGWNAIGESIGGLGPASDEMAGLSRARAGAVQRVWLRGPDGSATMSRKTRPSSAYMSDFALMSTACCSWRDWESARSDRQPGSRFVVSSAQPDERWHLYDCDSPSASGARGFNPARALSPATACCGSVAQEA